MTITINDSKSSTNEFTVVQMLSAEELKQVGGGFTLIELLPVGRGRMHGN